MNNLQKAKELHAAQTALQNAAHEYHDVCICVHYPLDYVSETCYTVKSKSCPTWYEFNADGELLRPELGEPAARELCKLKLREFLQSES